MRRRMTLRRPTSAALAVSLFAALAVLAGCENTRENDAGREGLPEEIGHLEYNVYITRQLNLRDVEDSGYYKGPEAPPGFALFGVFLQACNPNEDVDAPHWLAAGRFEIEDTQGNKFTPRPIPADNIWAYRPRPLKQNACIPERGSLAAAGPTSGSLLVFQLPLESLENRPLNLIITSPPIGPEQERESGRVELDV
jgi:hypothetical protein